MAKLEVTQIEGRKYRLLVKEVADGTEVVYSLDTSNLGKATTPDALEKELPPGNHQAKAAYNGQELTAPVEVPETPSAPEKTPQGPVILFHHSFAVIAAVVVLAVDALVVWRILAFTSGWMTARDKFGIAALVAIVLLVIGLGVTSAGIWMLAVELRGRMRTAKDVREVQNTVQGRGALAVALPGGIEQFGKLTGPASVLVAGMVPLVAAAWIAASAVTPPAGSATEEATETATEEAT